MEDIFVQEYTYAVIDLYRNYSKISEKPRLNANNTGGYPHTYDLFSDFNGFEIIQLAPKNRRHKYYYTTDSLKWDDKENVAVKIVRKSFHTTKERHIKRYYNNPHSRICVYTTKRAIKRNGDKLTISNYSIIRRREYNHKNIHNRFILYSITINLKTGNITTVELVKSGDKNKMKTTSKKIRTNYFSTLYRFIRNEYFMNEIKTYLKRDDVTFKEFNNTFNDFDFFKEFYNVLGKDFPFDFKEDFPMTLIDIFCKIKKIKLPNNYKYYISNHYPTQKFLKKNDNKLISAILDSYGIKSKTTINIVHSVDILDFRSFIDLCKLFGTNYGRYLSMINRSVFDKIHDTKSNRHFIRNIYNMPDYGMAKILTDNERKCIVKIVNTADTDLSSIVPTIFDHIRIINDLMKYGYRMYISSSTYEEFVSDEHNKITKYLSLLRKGEMIQYTYNEDTIKDIETPMDVFETQRGETPTCTTGNDLMYTYLTSPTVIKKRFLPVILKNENEYIEEGDHMHHCVSSYSRKDSSIIISLRYNDERVTSEFNIETGRCLQSRYYCNQSPPEYFNGALQNLYDKVKRLAMNKKLKWESMEIVKTQLNVSDLEKIEPVAPTVQQNNNLVPFFEENNFEMVF